MSPCLEGNAVKALMGFVVAGVRLYGVVRPWQSRALNEARGVRGVSVWQRGYYDQILQDPEPLRRTQD